MPTKDSKRSEDWSRWFPCSNASIGRSRDHTESKIVFHLCQLSENILSGIGATFPRLTKRHIEVIMGTALDMSRKQIAADLGIGIKNTEFHLRKVHKIIKASTTVGIYRFALKHRMIKHEN